MAVLEAPYTEVRKSIDRSSRNRIRHLVRGQRPIPTSRHTDPITATAQVGWSYRADRRANSKETFLQFHENVMSLQRAELKMLEAVASIQFSPHTRAADHGPQVAIALPTLPALQPITNIAGAVGPIHTTRLANPAPVQSITTLTPDGGTDAAPTSTNQITVPVGHNAVSLFVGDRPLSEFYSVLHVKVGEASARQYNVYRNRPIIIPAAAGTVVSINTQTRAGAAFTLVNTVVPIKACTYAYPTSLTAPTGVTGLANVDESGSPVWAPTIANIHVTLPEENSHFQINAAAGRRHYFMVEFDDYDNPTPVRHLCINSNKTLKVRCRFRRIALATYGGEALSITAPTGATIGGVSTRYRPTYTALAGSTGAVTASTPAEVKAGLNSTAFEVIVFPGTYDMSGSGLPWNNTNYDTARQRTLRLRSSTGDPEDVVFTDSAVAITITAGNRWVIEGVTFDVDGVAGVVFTGRIDGLDVVVTGPGSGTSPNLSINGATGYGAMTNTWAYCTITGTVADGINVSQTNGQTAGETLVQIVGTIIDGNGASGNNSQILTPHNASVLAAYGCYFTDAAATSNQILIAADGSSFVYTLYCSCPSDAITHTVGMGVTAQGVFFCDYGAVQRFIVGQSGALVGYVVGTIATQRVTSAVGIIYADTVTAFPLIAGCDLATDTDSGCHGFHCFTNFEITGNRVAMGGTSTSSMGIRVNQDPASACVVRSRNNHFSGTGYRPIELGTSANLSVSLINDIFDLNAGTMSFGASGTTDNVAENCFFPVSSNPTNFATRFTGAGAITSNVDVALNYWSGGTAPGLDADGVPTTPGLSDAEGKDVSIYGALDRLGRALRLGGSFVRGPVEVTGIKGSAVMSPVEWT
jgi:hypothetical protein